MQRRDEVTVTGVDLDGMVEVLAGAPVSVAVLFGSVAKGDDAPDSDVDVGVIFDASLTSRERTAARLSLIRDLTVQLGSDSVDVVPLSGAPPELLEEVRRDGVLLVGSPTEFESIVSNGSSDAVSENSDSTLGELVDDIEEVV